VEHWVEVSEKQQVIFKFKMQSKTNKTNDKIIYQVFEQKIKSFEKA
jgi:hypothetical protein